MIIRVLGYGEFEPTNNTIMIHMTKKERKNLIKNLQSMSDDATVLAIYNDKIDAKTITPEIKAFKKKCAFDLEEAYPTEPEVVE